MDGDVDVDIEGKAVGVIGQTSGTARHQKYIKKRQDTQTFIYILHTTTVDDPTLSWVNPETSALVSATHLALEE
jgi:hypothetical protein